eukprot:4225633-Prymnesium_polylepis.1
MAMLFKRKAIPPALSELDDQGRQMAKRLGLNSTPEVTAPVTNKAVRDERGDYWQSILSLGSQ